MIKHEITLREHMQRIAASGGNAAAKNMTKEQRHARAMKASQASARARYKNKPDSVVNM